MRRLVLALAFAVLAGRAPAATVCAGDLPPPKLAAVDKPPAPEPQAVAVLRAGSPAAADFPYMRELALQWRMNRDKDALKRLATYFDAWTGVYHPSFDPVGEESLTGFIDAYAVAAPYLPVDVRARVRPFLYTLARGYLQRLRVHDPRLRTNSRASRAVELRRHGRLGAGRRQPDAPGAARLCPPDPGRDPSERRSPRRRPHPQAGRRGGRPRPARARGRGRQQSRPALARPQRPARPEPARGPGLAAAVGRGPALVARARPGRQRGPVGPNHGREPLLGGEPADDRYLATALSAGPVPPHWIWAQAPCGGTA